MPAPSRGAWRDAVDRLDTAVYAAIAATPTLDRAFRGLSRAADHSALWFANAGLRTATGGNQGPRAPANGVCSIALSSVVVNGLLKPLSARRRPDRQTYNVPVTRRVTMPRSTSFPCGHSASAFAFATRVAAADPRAGIPLHGVAGLVAYSRIHGGVTIPGEAAIADRADREGERAALGFSESAGINRPGEGDGSALHRKV